MKRKKRSHEVLLCVAVSALLIAAVSSVYAVSTISENKLAEKLYTDQIPAGAAESFDEFFDNLETLQREFFSRGIMWTAEDRGSAEVTILSFEPETNLKELRENLEKSLNSVTVFTKAKIFLFGMKLDYEINFDEEKVKAAFASSGIEQGTADAYYAFDASHSLGVTPEQIGIGVDTAAVSKLVSSYFKDFDAPETAALPLQTSSPEITADLLNKYLPEANTILSKELELKDDKGRTWTLTMSDHADWIFPQSGDFLIRPELFASYIGNEISPDISIEASPVAITENEDGTISFEGSARNGQEIDLEKFRAEVEDYLNGKKENVETASGEISEETRTDGPLDIPVITIAPSITAPDSLKAKGITGLLGVGYSTLRGSPVNRIHNIKYGVSKFNGIIIAPLEEFSFTTVLGHVDAAHGWLPELVIKGDETIPEFGGGLCQVSTTMYRAALYSGLPITQRRNHSYAVSYYAFPYGYGLDATVYEPWPDMRFVNDTAGSILVQSYVDGTDVYYVFYGTPDGRYVKMEGPTSYDYAKIEEPIIEYSDELPAGERKLKDHAHTGFKVDWYRSVFNADGSLRIDNERIHSEYEARPEKYLEGRAETK